MPRTEQTKLNRWRRELATQTTEAEKATRAVANHTAAIEAHEVEAARLAALGDTAGATSVRATRDRLVAERAKSLAELARVREDLRDALHRGPIDIALDPG